MKIKEIKIGKQIWMSSNLNVSRFRNGDLIFEAKTIDEWQKADENGLPAFCNYQNDTKNELKFGKLYNWHAVNDERKLAPENWRIPSDREFEELSMFLGGSKKSGNQLKNVNRKAFKSNNFNALLGGARLWSFEFYGINHYGFFWTSTEYNKYFSWHRVLIENYDILGRVNRGGKGMGMSIRCIK
jgi:uncharacterized protein (TIGR02145 family)